jgi:hypothetical protein
MSETTILLEVAAGPHIQRLPFATREAALEQLALMEAKISRRFSNNPDVTRHRVEALDGAAVFDMETVSSVRVIDHAAFAAAVGWVRGEEKRERDEAFGAQAEVIAQAIRMARTS